MKLDILTNNDVNSKNTQGYSGVFDLRTLIFIASYISMLICADERDPWCCIPVLAM